MSLINKLKCKLGKHERVYWTWDECESANVMSGIWTPWKCKRCGCESGKFPRPKRPTPRLILRPDEILNLDPNKPNRNIRGA